MDPACKRKTPGTDREIEELLSTPTPAAIDAVGQLRGDFMVLGASGKMGVSQAVMARRALDAAGRKQARVIGVARFRDASARAELEAFGIETIACDLSDSRAVASLPPAANVLYLAGQKFGTAHAPETTWVQNAVVPAYAADRFRDSRIVVFSTGCVYPFSPVTGPGANEQTPLGFLGEYATTCIGRERVFTHYSKTNNTPTLLFRLNYSVEYRYGVLADIGSKVLRGESIGLDMAVTNVIWQQDACARALQSLLHVDSPPKLLNITGANKVGIRLLAEKFGAALGREPIFVGQPQPTAWHIDASESVRLFGPPLVELDTMITRVADYLQAGGRLLGKPTHFEVRDGSF